MRERKVELLAPAGDWEAFVAAVENGADAVYMGGKLFNARQFAGNFDSEKLKEALDYAHIRGVKIYLTMNTLMADSELKQALELVEEAYVMGIDGIIVQDLGLAGMLRKIFPDLDLHASTQMTIYNEEGVKALEGMGFKRVVLARELSIEEIARITQNTSLEIEVFIHGALCVSYSGQCLMSSIIGGRSGNRGKCAQPCRLRYELVADAKGNEEKSQIHEKGYIMSPRDLCSLNDLREIVKAGVKSLKIEGRMKSPEYVATVVRIYRKYLDEILGEDEKKEYRINREDMRDLAQIFNRGGFTSGYFQGKLGKDMMSYEKPKNWGILLGEVISYDQASKIVKVKLQDEVEIGDGIEIWNGEEESPGTVVTEIRINGRNASSASCGEVAGLGGIAGKISRGNKVYRTSSKRLNTGARESYTGKSGRKTGIFGKMYIKHGEYPRLEISDNLGNRVQVAGNTIPEAALNRPLTEERIAGQLGKTGSTPFEFKSVEIELEENLSLPVSEINDIRRKALEELENRRLRAESRSLSNESIKLRERLLHFPGNSRKEMSKLQISALFYQWHDKYDISSMDADRFYIPFNAFLNDRVRETLLHRKNTGTEVFVWLPAITRGNYDHLIKSKLDNIIQSGIDGILAGNIGTLEFIGQEKGLKIMGDYPLNVFNSFTLEKLVESGLHGATLSPEMTLKEIGSLKHFEGFLKEALVYGRLPLMTSEYCPVGSIAGGHGEKTECNQICTKGRYKLRDRMGMEFPVLCDRIDCRSIIMNANVVVVADSLDRIRTAGVNMVRLNITDEEPALISEIIEVHRDVAQNGEKALSKHREIIEAIKQKGFTKGHYYRGV